MGGWKESGLGVRHGAAGIRKYTRQQAILVTRFAMKRDVHFFPYSARTTKLLGRLTKLLYGRGSRTRGNTAQRARFLAIAQRAKPAADRDPRSGLEQPDPRQALEAALELVGGPAELGHAARRGRACRRAGAISRRPSSSRTSTVVWQQRRHARALGGLEPCQRAGDRALRRRRGQLGGAQTWSCTRLAA